MSEEQSDNAETNPFKMGHNQPPTEDQREMLESANKDLIEKKDEMMASVARMPSVITSDEMEGKFIDTVKILKAAAKDADNRQKVAKAPFLEGGRTVDGFFKPIQTTFLTSAKNIEGGALRKYQQARYEKEQRRLAAEREEARKEEEVKRKEAEAAAKLLTTEEDLGGAVLAEEHAEAAASDVAKAEKAEKASVADLTRTHATYGGKASSSKKAAFEITDLKSVDLDELRPFLKREAIEMAIRSYMKIHGTKAADIPEIVGVRFFDDFKTTVR